MTYTKLPFLKCVEMPETFSLLGTSSVRVNILLQQACPLCDEMIVVSWIRAHQTSGGHGGKKEKKYACLGSLKLH